MKKNKNFLTLFLAINFLSISVYAGEYSLFNPVPKDKLRRMTTERPSKSNSAYTIDAGHIQVETSLYSLNKNNDKGSKTQSQSALDSTTVRVGLTQSDEFLVSFTPMTWQKSKDSSQQTRQSDSSFGDTTLMYKHNFLGNDTEVGPLFAVIPYLKVPTSTLSSSNNHYEGGFRTRYKMSFENEYGFGYTFDAGAVRRRNNQSYVAAVTNIVDFGKMLTSKTFAYVEFFSSRSLEQKTSSQNTLDFGLIHEMSKNFVIDTAINFGVSSAADDFLFITGGSYRF